MIAMIFDTETTGVDVNNDRIVQYGALIYDTVARKVLDVRSWMAWEKNYPSVAESGKIHGFTLGDLLKYGRHPLAVLTEMKQFSLQYQVELVIAHNGLKFDKPILQAEYDRQGISSIPGMFGLVRLPWLDTVAHAEYPGSPGKNMLTLCAHHGFINPFPHDAVGDCYALAKIIANPERDLVLEMAQRAAATHSLIFANLPRLPKQEFEVVLAQVKEKKFSFENLEGHHYEKSWIKIIPLDEFASFAASCPFQVNLIKDLPPGDGYTSLVNQLIQETTCK